MKLIVFNKNPSSVLDFDVQRRRPVVDEIKTITMGCGVIASSDGPFPLN